MDYLQVDIYTTTSGIDPVGAMLTEVGTGGFAVQDAADFAAFLENKTPSWDYVEDELMKLLESETTVSTYLPENEQGAQMLAAIEDGLLRLKGLDAEQEWGRLTFEVKAVREQDWAEAWKQYYRPVKVGQRLVVCPSWEEYSPAEDEIVLELDPGMAFGTGTHASTSLCMRMLEKHTHEGMRMLDVGCGSGILAVSALLLGAGEAVGVDLDSVSVRVAKENAARNGVADKVTFVAGNLADRVTGTFDVICANIVADVIIGFAPQVSSLMRDDAVFICSGIIAGRADEVAAALESAGLEMIEQHTDSGWSAAASRRRQAGCAR